MVRWNRALGEVLGELATWLPSVGRVMAALALAKMSGAGLGWWAIAGQLDVLERTQVQSSARLRALG
jgi:hypothetical protein